MEENRKINDSLLTQKFIIGFICRYHWNPKALKIKRKTNSLLRDMLYMGKAESVIIEYVVFLEFSNLIFDLPPSSTHDLK